MIYKKFYFENYKGIINTNIELDENHKLHCIVGRNESGKTTILGAIYDVYLLLKENKSKTTFNFRKKDNEKIYDKINKITPRNINFADKILSTV